MRMCAPSLLKGKRPGADERRTKRSERKARIIKRPECIFFDLITKRSRWSASTAEKSWSSLPILRAVLYISFARRGDGHLRELVPEREREAHVLLLVLQGNAGGYAPLITRLFGPVGRRPHRRDERQRDDLQQHLGRSPPPPSAKGPPRRTPSCSPSRSSPMKTFAPAPTSAQEEVRLAHHLQRLSFARVYSASSPAAMKMSAPCSAGAFDPETGASRNDAPVLLMCLEICAEVPASTVETSS